MIMNERQGLLYQSIFGLVGITYQFNQRLPEITWDTKDYLPVTRDY